MIIRYNFFILCYILLLSSNICSQHILVTHEGNLYSGKVKYRNCNKPQKCGEVKISFKDSYGEINQLVAEKVDFFQLGKAKYIVRRITSNHPYRAYMLLLDGEIKVFNLDLNNFNEIAAVELKSGLIIPVTEKLFNKWILPEYLQKKGFKDWYERNNSLFFPTRKKDTLGGKKQNQINYFIIQLTQIYNQFS